MFSKKQWIHDAFCTGTIRRDREGKVLHLHGT
jgi:hypothetical protein